MAGSISDFKASFRKDLARPNRFDVNIPVPIGMIPFYNVARELKFRCEATELPGRSLATSSMKVYNIEEKFPYQTTFGDLSMTFIVSDDMREKIFFDQWVNWINPQTTYDMKYKKDYAVTLSVYQYDLQGKLSYAVDLYEAYPVAFNPMALDWSSDGFHKLNVIFTYTSWRNTTLSRYMMDGIQRNIDNIRTSSSLYETMPAPVESRAVWNGIAEE